MNLAGCSNELDNRPDDDDLPLYKGPDMFEAWSAGFRWCAEGVEIVDGELCIPHDNPGCEGLDHNEAWGAWLLEYDEVTGRVTEDGEYVRGELKSPAEQTVLDAAAALGAYINFTSDAHDAYLVGRAVRIGDLLAALDALNAERGQQHRLVHVERTDGRLVPGCACGWWSADGSHWRFEQHIRRVMAEAKP